MVFLHKVCPAVDVDLDLELLAETEVAALQVDVGQLLRQVVMPRRELIVYTD